MIIRRLAPVMILAYLAVSCGDKKPTAPRDEINVALYSGRGADADCKTAAQKMFEWMGYKVQRISPNQINTGSLDGFDLICFPGGNMYYYSQDISVNGKQRIKQFVSGGGGYIGICGGAYFAAERVFWRGDLLDMTPLSLFRGAATGPINQIYQYPDYGMCRLDIAILDHPITSGEDASMSVLYYWGPYLSPNTGFEFDVICDYHVTGSHAMVAFEHGQGRVFLTGAHPEFEEDSDRDGVEFCDVFDDQGSDWDFMKKAARWCLKKI
ncbi:MAG: hypothetical protein JSV33_13040 [bacterium]|nr:MAG: hypothetical protein JSV33_13040 [bacterium]